MMQKLEKVLDLAAEALSLYVRKTTAELGEGLPLETKPEKKLRKVKGLAELEAERPTLKSSLKETSAKSPFALGPSDEPAAAKVSIEDAAEAKRRAIELGGLFIRRYVNTKPTGLERFKDLVNRVCGRTIVKLEDLTHEDNLKLIPVFEAELEKADAK